jgi:addiction module HigA family antidote
MAETTRNQYQPDTVSPPGETLLETLESLGLTQVELAERTGWAREAIDEIVGGKTAITPETALQLERVLGIPAGVRGLYPLVLAGGGSRAGRLGALRASELSALRARTPTGFYPAAQGKRRFAAPPWVSCRATLGFMPRHPGFHAAPPWDRRAVGSNPARVLQARSVVLDRRL